MRFLARSLVGALLTVLTLGLVALGLWRMQDAGEEAAGRGAGQPDHEGAVHLEGLELRL